MIGDKLLIKIIHKKKAKKILPFIMSTYYHNKIVVAIGGQSGTGKTEVSHLLQQALWDKHKIRSCMISVDDYYKTMWNDRNKVRAKGGMNLVGMCEIDWVKLTNLIRKFNSKDKLLNIQRIHKFTNTYEKVTINNKAIDVLIIEGIYACHLKEATLKIFLEGNIDDTKKFREERKKEIQTPFRMRVLKKEAKEVSKTKKSVDIVISK